jgi:hypothetical protein
MRTLLTRDGGQGKWRRVSSAKYRHEAHLHQLLHASPELFPWGDLGDDVPQPTVAVAEMGLPGAGTTDLVYVDERGMMTVVECKLARNPESKRKVVGQILQYAAALWRLPYDEFERRALLHLQRCHTCQARLAAQTGGTHGTASSPDLAGWAGAGVADFDAAEFRAQAERHLTVGDFRLVIVVDRLTDDLRQTLEYANREGSASSPINLMALELEYFEVSESGASRQEILLPHLVGAPPGKHTPPRSAITEEELFMALREHHGDVAAVTARGLAALATKLGGLEWGISSFRLKTSFGRKRLSLYSVDTQGLLWVGFPNLIKNNVPMAIVNDFAARLRGIESLADAQPERDHYTIRKLTEVFTGEREAEQFEAAVSHLRRQLTSR